VVIVVLKKLVVVNVDIYAQNAQALEEIVQDVMFHK
jgi:hypothetical protein